MFLCPLHNQLTLRDPQTWFKLICILPGDLGLEYIPFSADTLLLVNVSGVLRPVLLVFDSKLLCNLWSTISQHIKVTQSSSLQLSGGPSV